jgi:hypothetical protein
VPTFPARSGPIISTRFKQTIFPRPGLTIPSRPGPTIPARPQGQLFLSELGQPFLLGPRANCSCQNWANHSYYAVPTIPPRSRSV